MRASLVGLLALCVGGIWWWSVRAADALVVYCAHDAMHAEAVLAAFEAETGIDVEVRYDNEATKSLGLIEAIASERAAPRCDVLWNNEVLGTMWLARQGLLAEYRGTGWQRIPERWRDPAGHWVGFGGRLRVWIRQRGFSGSPQAALERGWAAGDLAGMGYARPVFGTTRAHATAMWSVRGRAAATQWWDGLVAAGASELSGNASVKDAVAAGQLLYGWTDTDDAFVAQDAGAAVEFEPVLLDGRALCVPNTAAIVRSTDQPEHARRLVDWLASEATELRLARSRARQIPLGPVPAEAWPDDVARFRDAAATAWDVGPWDDVADDVLIWLRERVLR